MSRQNNNIITEPQMNPNPNSGPMPTSSRTNHRIPNMTMKRTIIALLYTLGALLASSIAVEAATLLPPGKNCFNDANGDPLAAGTVGMYIPTTFTAKDTWTDAGETTLNVDPVPLDSAGCAIIYGTGTYRQIVKDSLGNTIWDQLTASTGNQTGVILYGGTSTGSANAQLITVSGFTATDGQLVSFVAGFSNSGATTVNAGTGAIAVRYDSNGGPVALTGNEIRVGNGVVLLYTGGFFHMVNPGIPTFPLSVANGGTGGTTVLSAAPSTVASFSANKNGTNQTGIANSTITKITFTTEAFDVGSHYDTSLSRWTPPAGTALINACIGWTGLSSDSAEAILIRKNGTTVKNTVTGTTNSPSTVGSGSFTTCITDLESVNGTDYFEIWAEKLDFTGASNAAVYGSTVPTFFQGTME